MTVTPMPRAALPLPCATPNAVRRYEVRCADLPIHCPTDEMCLWNSHPRVYLPLQEAGDEVLCPYCGALYTLVE